ncbi:MAG: PIN-like domain-containing protein [Boseongicola sp.]|nr:PIN-like domain-containing protein [Boseongicola sp.]
MDELTEVLESPQSRFYLDTSLLMWLVRLSPEARSEFLIWCRNRPDGSVRVPVWAAHELHHHLTGNIVAANIRSAVSETLRQLDDFARLASERADEEDCRKNGFASRQGFVAEVDHTIAKVKQFANVVRSDSKLNAAAEEVIDLVNDFTLETNISEVIDSLRKTGDFRYSHRVPPGFHDLKDKNRFGDVIIWEEIIEDIRVEEFSKRRHCVLISRDDKTDWVSSAPLVSEDNSSKKSNRDIGLDVTRPHPLLVHEFEGRARGGKLYVVHPSLLASALEYTSRRTGTASTVSNWLAAAHRSDLLPRLAVTNLQTPISEATTTASLGEARSAPVPTTSPSADSTQSYPTATELMALPTTDEMNSYMQATPLDQPDVVQRWFGQLSSGEFPPERFGRLLAELSLREPGQWLSRVPSVVEDLRSELSSHSLNGIVLGVTVPVFFDRFGEALRQPRKELGSVVLLLESDTTLYSAFKTLAGYLAAADVELPYMPGTGRRKVPIDVDASDGSLGLKTLRDIRVASESVLADALPEDSPRRLTALMNREEQQRCSGQELFGLLSREYLLPPDLVDTELDKKRFTWAPDAGLVSLDTSSPGGISATVIDEGNDLE